MTPKKPSLTGPRRATEKRLSLRSRNVCAYKANCPNLLEDKDTIVGEICHIKAKKPEGPRYDPMQTDEERHGYDNLIMLCSKHAKIIDNKQRVKCFTVKLLSAWKLRHEHPERYEKSREGERLAGAEEPLPTISAAQKPVLEKNGVDEYTCYLVKQIIKAREIGDPTKLRELLEGIARIHEMARDWSEAAGWLRELSEVYFSVVDLPEAARVCGRLAYALAQIDDYPAARNALLRGACTLRKLPKGAALKAEAQIFEQLGMLCLQLGRPLRALNYLNRRALRARQLLRSPLGIASTKSRLGLVYAALDEPTHAIAEILDALQLRFRNGAKRDVGRSLRTLGSFHVKENQLLLAAFVLYTCLRWQESCRNKAAQAQTHFELAEIFVGLSSEANPMEGGLFTLNVLKFPEPREPILLKAIMDEIGPSERNGTLPISQFLDEARRHYLQCIEIGTNRLQSSFLEVAAAKLRQLAHVGGA